MDKKTLQDIAEKHVPTQHKGRNALIVFISGGILVAVAQPFMTLRTGMFDLDKNTAVSIAAVVAILVTAPLTGSGVYDKAAQKCGAGSFIPISGFAGRLTSCAIEGQTEGPIFGIGGNIFKLAGSILTYGIAAVFVLDMIRYLFFSA